MDGPLTSHEPAVAPAVLPLGGVAVAPSVDAAAGAPADVGAAVDISDPSLLANRELSWLDFNDRVLAEAFDPRNPLLERVKFLAITASNLDEFYAKRVGWLMYGLRSRARVRRTADGLTLQEQLDLVLERCATMRHDIERGWRDLRPLLQVAGVTVVSYADLEADARDRLETYFRTSVFPVLTPLVVDPEHPFPFISGGSLSVVALIDEHTSGMKRIARVKVPANRPRFVEAGGGRYVPLEELIVAHLDLLFPGVKLEHWETIRVLRSAETDTPGEAAEDLLDLIEQAIAQRRLAFACSLEVGGGTPEADVALLLDELQLESAHVVRLDGLLGLDDLFELAAIARPELAVTPVVPVVPAEFAEVPEGELLARIEQGDLLVHHPYESFDSTVVRFIEEAARDPKVLAIKQTVYRTSPDSPILAALVGAANRGKQVAVVVELTARFDEANNIEWARRLERAGVHVAYGLPRRKIHSKISLVVREHDSRVSVLGHIGTGNYNSNTARVYEDLGLFTADPVITADLVRVFNHLTGAGELTETSALLVAPMSLRSRIQSRVLREIDHALAGRPARIAMKMNALEDPEMTRLLYRASMAGVQVDLVIRGICRLRPGLPGISDHVRVVSVIGRFLEHSRIFYFANDGHPEWFIGSTDLMNRNLDDRVEVVTPIRDPAQTRRLAEVFDLLLEDRRQGWTLEDRRWHREQVDAVGTHETLLREAALPRA